MFSPTGKQICYGNPSLQSTKRTSLNEENHSENSIEKIVEAQRKMEVEKLNDKNDIVLDQMYAEEEREKTLGELLKPRKISGWWEVKNENINHVLAKGIDASLDEFKKKLVNALSIQDGGVVFHGKGKLVIDKNKQMILFHVFVLFDQFSCFLFFNSML